MPHSDIWTCLEHDFQVTYLVIPAASRQQWMAMLSRLLPGSKLPHSSSFNGGVLPVVSATERLLASVIQGAIRARVKLSLQARTRPWLSRRAVKCLLNKDGSQVPRGPPVWQNTVGKIFISHFSLIFISVSVNHISSADIYSRVDYGLEIFYFVVGSFWIYESVAEIELLLRRLSRIITRLNV